MHKSGWGLPSVGAHPLNFHQDLSGKSLFNILRSATLSGAVPTLPGEGEEAVEKTHGPFWVSVHCCWANPGMVPLIPAAYPLYAQHIKY